MSLDVVVDGGKYTVIQEADGMRFLRYGEPWPAADREFRHVGLILSLAQEVSALRSQPREMSQGDWRLLQRAARHYGHYLVRRVRRVSSEPDGADQRELDHLRSLAAPLAAASGEDGGFV